MKIWHTGCTEAEGQLAQIHETLLLFGSDGNSKVKCKHVLHSVHQEEFIIQPDGVLCRGG